MVDKFKFSAQATANMIRDLARQEFPRSPGLPVEMVSPAKGVWMYEVDCSGAGPEVRAFVSGFMYGRKTA